MHVCRNHVKNENMESWDRRLFLPRFIEIFSKAYQNIDEWKVFALNFDFGGALL